MYLGGNVGLLALPVTCSAVARFVLCRPVDSIQIATIYAPPMSQKDLRQVK